MITKRWKNARKTGLLWIFCVMLVGCGLTETIESSSLVDDSTQTLETVTEKEITEEEIAIAKKCVDDRINLMLYQYIRDSLGFFLCERVGDQSALRICFHDEGAVEHDDGNTEVQIFRCFACRRKGSCRGIGE